MLKLKNLQCDFISALQGKNVENITNYIKNPTTDANFPLEEIFAIYQNNLKANLNAALVAIYPIIKKLLGAEFFNFACHKFIFGYHHKKTRIYIAGNMPRNCNLDEYGSEFPEFLRNFPPAKHLLYLEDIALFEWAVHKVQIANKPQSFDARAISKLQQKDYYKLNLSLRDNTEFITSKYKIAKLWQILSKQAELPPNFHIELQRKQNFLVTTKNFAPVIYRISNQELIFLQSFKKTANSQNANLETIYNQLSQNITHHHLQKFFLKAINRGLFAR